MYLNTKGTAHWLTITLRGTKSNRDGYGARVQVNGRTRFATSTQGYLSASDKRLRFGLGSDESAKVDILWPSRTMMSAYPGSPRAHEAMGENYFVLRQMPQAEREFREALKLQPDLPEAHLELGMVYSGASQWDKAEEEFRAQTKLQPGNAEAAYRLGSTLLQQGKVHEARQELQRANRLLPDMPETLYSLGKAASLEGDSRSAEDAWDKVISIEKASPLAAQAHFGLASLYRKQGKTAEAAREMQEFKKLQGAASANPN